MYQSQPSVTTAIARTRSWSGTTIDAIANLAGQRVFLFVGALDTTVSPSVVDQLYRYDATFVPAASIEYRKDVLAAHTFPTDFDSAGDNPCLAAVPPYISN